ncbi:MAG: DUF523 domain-containing protein [Firmicutes bacterium]|nr:DUF523 domain-containing protein [Bacillota bacterium]
MKKHKILVSRCLYGGEPVRYDGKIKEETDKIFSRWRDEGMLIPVCPEVDGGLPVPRPPAEITVNGIINSEGTDVTGAYKAGAEIAVKRAIDEDAAFCIMKEGSPSCGSSCIYDGSFSGCKIPGEGLTVKLLREKGFKVFSEKEIKDAAEYLLHL